MPDVEASQSRSAAQTDDSLATNPSAGLVTEGDPPTRRRGGWWRAGIFAGAACLAWLAWPTAAFALTNTLSISVDDVTGDNTINRSEHTNNFAVTGNTGTDSGVTVTVTIGGTALTSVTSAIAVAATEATWSVTVPANADYITETSVELSVTATKPNYTDAPSVSRTLTVDLTPPTVSYMEPSNLTVGVLITPIAPTTSDTDIVSYAISSGSLPPGLSLNGVTGVISGVPTTGTPNMQTVGVLATDGAGNVDRPQITFPAVVAGTLTLNVDDVTGDNTINRSEHTNNFAVTGNTGTDSGVTVTVTIGGTALTSVTSAIAVAATEATWSVTVPANADIHYRNERGAFGDGHQAQLYRRPVGQPDADGGFDGADGELHGAVEFAGGRGDHADHADQERGYLLLRD